MRAVTRCELVPWGRMLRLVRRLALQIRAAGFQPDLIVAIARGGYVPARVLADYLGVMDVTSFRIEHYLRGARQQPAARVRHPLARKVDRLRVLAANPPPSGPPCCTTRRAAATGRTSARAKSRRGTGSPIHGR